MGDTEGIRPDLSGFEALNRSQGAHCQYRFLLDALTPEQRAGYDAALLADHIQTTAIVRWLSERGVQADKTGVARHRSKHGQPVECKTCRI